MNKLADGGIKVLENAKAPITHGFSSKLRATWPIFRETRFILKEYLHELKVNDLVKIAWRIGGPKLLPSGLPDIKDPDLIDAMVLKSDEDGLVQVLSFQDGPPINFWSTKSNIVMLNGIFVLGTPQLAEIERRSM